MSFSISSNPSIKKYTDVDKKELKPGDLIEIDHGLYRHWAVYVGGGNVVHFQAPFGSGPSSSIGVSISNSSSYGVVKKEKLEDVVETYTWRINNLLDEKYTPRSVNDIVKEACSLAGTELPYDFLKYNCEHFATEMRYGKRESRQAQNAEVAGILGILAVGLWGGPASDPLTELHSDQSINRRWNI